MLYVSIFVELLRSRPALAIWVAALAQAALWTLVPLLFYYGPPGDLPNVLAVGHEFQLGTYLGPPLAFWLADLAFEVAGLFGVYALSQICVVVTYWAVFTLGRSIVGAQHAALAVLLMVMLGGAWMPTFLMPKALARVGMFFPTRWAVEGLDAMTWRGLGFGDAIAPVGVLLGFSAAFAAIAWAKFRWDVE